MFLFFMRERHGVCLVIGFIHANVDKGLGDLAVTGTSGLQRFDSNVLDSPYPKILHERILQAKESSTVTPCAEDVYPMTVPQVCLSVGRTPELSLE